MKILILPPYLTCKLKWLLIIFPMAQVVCLVCPFKNAT